MPKAGIDIFYFVIAIFFVKKESLLRFLTLNTRKDCVESGELVIFLFSLALPWQYGSYRTVPLDILPQKERIEKKLSKEANVHDNMVTSYLGKKKFSKK